LAVALMHCWRHAETLGQPFKNTNNETITHRSPDSIKQTYPLCMFLFKALAVALMHCWRHAEMLGQPEKKKKRKKMYQQRK